MNRFHRIIRILTSSPVNLPSMVYHRCASRFSYHCTQLLNNHSFSPEGINIYPTDRCNLKCSMCFERLKTPLPELSIDAWSAIITRIARFRPRIHLSGGEPFLYRNIGDLMTEIKRRRLYLAITTNGTFLEKYAPSIVNLGVNRIHLSIDGPAEIHDRIRGVPGTYDRIMNGLRRIKECRRNRGLPVIRINAMINTTDPKAMKTILTIARDINAEGIQFLHPLFVDSQDLAVHRTFLRNVISQDLNYWRGADVPGEPPRDYHEFNRFLKTLRTDSKIPVEIFPAFTPQQMRAYYEKHKDFYARYPGRCLAMWNTMTILPSGDIESCPDYIVGNCRNQDILELWNNDHMKALRTRLRQHEFFTVCRACCYFYFK